MYLKQKVLMCYFLINEPNTKYVYIFKELMAHDCVIHQKTLIIIILTEIHMIKSN